MKPGVDVGAGEDAEIVAARRRIPLVGSGGTATVPDAELFWGRLAADALYRARK
jgi:hypothetical protein